MYEMKLKNYLVNKIGANTDAIIVYGTNLTITDGSICIWRQVNTSQGYMEIIVAAFTIEHYYVTCNAGLNKEYNEN